MKAKILAAVSALAVLMAATAYSEANASALVDTNTNTTITTENIKAEVKEGWQDTKEGVVNAAEKTEAATKNAYEDIKARVIDEKSANTDITINSRMTAKGMLGQPVHNAKNEKIATLKDIILDKNGKAVMAVVSDGGFMGIGDKLAAFDYSLVMQQEANGDVIMPLNEEALSKVAAFSYDTSEASDKVHVIPANGYSVSELLKGKLVDPQNKAMGNIENITFRNGEASQVIVAFDQKIGMGGERAALDFDDLTLAKAGDGALDFRMNTRQSAQFEQYKNTNTN